MAKRVRLPFTAPVLGQASASASASASVYVPVVMTFSTPRRTTLIPYSRTQLAGDEWDGSELAGGSSCPSTQSVRGSI